MALQHSGVRRRPDRSGGPCYKEFGEQYSVRDERRVQAVMNEGEHERMKQLCTAIAAEQVSEKMIAWVQELNRLVATKQARLDQRCGKLDPAHSQRRFLLTGRGRRLHDAQIRECSAWQE
jgi:hypothetical protein